MRATRSPVRNIPGPAQGALMVAASGSLWFVQVRRLQSSRDGTRL